MSRGGRGHRGKDRKGPSKQSYRERVRRRRKEARARRAQEVAVLLETLGPACDLSRIGVANSIFYRDGRNTFKETYCSKRGIVKIACPEVGPPTIISIRFWNDLSNDMMKNLTLRLWEPVMNKSPLILLAECAEG